jgi:hypothetical protein
VEVQYREGIEEEPGMETGRVKCDWIKDSSDDDDGSLGSVVSRAESSGGKSDENQVVNYGIFSEVGFR